MSLRSTFSLPEEEEEPVGVEVWWPQGGLNTGNSKRPSLCCGGRGGGTSPGHSEGVEGPGENPPSSLVHTRTPGRVPHVCSSYSPPQGLPRDRLQGPVWGSFLLPYQVEGRCWQDEGTPGGVLHTWAPSSSGLALGLSRFLLGHTPAEGPPR